MDLHHLKTESALMMNLHKEKTGKIFFYQSEFLLRVKQMLTKMYQQLNQIVNFFC